MTKKTKATVVKAEHEGNSEAGSESADASAATRSRRSQNLFEFNFHYFAALQSLGFR